MVRELEVITFIKEYGLDHLAEKYSIKVKRHQDFNNLVLLKYSQIGSDMGSKIVQQCRGIILDEANDFKPVCYSFDKFFNYEEGHAAKIDWSNCRIIEKADGSLIQLYYYADSWRVATSGTPDASGNVLDTGTTFKDLFWKVWDGLGYKLPSDKGISYSFELMTPFNLVVVQHKESSIVLTGARRLSDFRELNHVVEAHHNEWKCVKIFNFEDKDEIINSLRSMKGSEQEGFVVCDTKYNRVKMKCGDYVKRHRLVSSASVRNILDVIRTNEESEFILHCPQFKDLCHDIKVKYEYMVGKIEGFYSAIESIDDRKQFAMAAKDQIFSGALFGLKYNKVSSVREALADMNIKNLENWLDIKDVIL